MRIAVFAGPSLPPEDRKPFAGVEWCPPAQAGDLLRLLPDPPDRICLIDGAFDHRPAVRHKEILLLLSRGVRIWGAASIGALRAAEMGPFGMTGIGAIWRGYRHGLLVGDDEVALVHAPARWNWKPLSVPLVDVRATLARAVRERTLSADAARRLRALAAAIHYADRSWGPLAAAGGARFAAWLEGNAVALKRADARACLRAATTDFSSPPAPPAAVETAFLRALARQCPPPAPCEATAPTSPAVPPR